MNFSDLARQLNVSTATVSRALSRPDKVAPATRKRVLEFVRRSGYHINGIARSLRTQSTRTIGVIVSDIRNPFSSAIVKSVEDVARTNGYTVLICNADEDGRNEEAALELFLERQVSGVIHCSAGANLDLLRVLLEKSIPLVDLDRQSGLHNVDTVILDNQLGATLATRHLVELGHRRVAMISGPRHLSNARKRLDAFRKTLRSTRIVVPKEYVAESVVRSLHHRIKGKRVLLLRAKVARDVIPRDLRKAGAQVDVVEAYETVVPQSSRRQLQSALKNPKRRPHVVTFTSSSTVKNFVELLGVRDQRKLRLLLDGVRMSSIGPVTSTTLRASGLSVDISAEEFTIPGLVAAIVAAISPRSATP